jgi:cytochrome c-type protein NapC
MADTSPRPGLLRRTWLALTRPSPWSLAAILGIGVLAGVVLWGGLNTAMEATNKEAFCISCHEMRENVYREYSENTIHYSNRTGVRATCPDCHVPKAWGPKVLRKIQASKEVWGKLTGTIDTREKFEAKRLELAQHEWARMKANDSLECRNCHDFKSMRKDAQKPRAQKSHELAVKNNETCIDCHKGIAHHKPQNMPEDDE